MNKIMVETVHKPRGVERLVAGWWIALLIWALHCHPPLSMR